MSRKIANSARGGGDAAAPHFQSSAASSAVSGVRAFSGTRRSRWKAVREHIIRAALFCCGMISIATTLGIVGVLVYETSGFFAEVSVSDFLFDTQWTPLFTDNRHFGIWPLISGTFLTSFIALMIAIPIGLLLAIFLCEFATPRTRRVLKPFLEILAGVPTVVYGYFALLTVTPFLQKFFPELSGFNALAPGLVMGVMILPIVASLSEDALYAVPRSMKEGAYALGSSKLQMIFGVLIPSALGGISAAFILGMSRAVGETMIVAIAAGQQAVLSVNPMEPLQTMTAYIVQISLGDTPHGTLEFRTIFAVAGVLFLITFGLNYISQRMRERYELSLRG